MTDDDLMGVCLELAEEAARRGEVPVGAVVVADGQIVGRGANQTIGNTDPSAHAEIVALRAAARYVGNHRLAEAELVVTLEPCLMCVGAILQARVRRVVFGCTDEKGGFLGSLADYSADPRLNHAFAVRGGVRADDAAALLREFFRARRR